MCSAGESQVLHLDPKCHATQGTITLWVCYRKSITVGDCVVMYKVPKFPNFSGGSGG
jgi:hypothetical protein